ncbi:MAG TPA: Clp protease N-terminal domain-containing protein [Phytomonospora sp.]
MSPFDEFLHTAIERARMEAHEDGSDAAEAHHLLLAVAAAPEPAAGPVLAAAGLDRAAVADALRREYEASLAVVGVDLASFDLAPPVRTPLRSIRIGATLKQLLQRSFTTSRKKDLRPAHILLGLLQIEAGTVPRALAIAGVDRAALAADVRRAL